MPSEALLSLAGVTRRFGGLLAVDDVSFTLTGGELIGLIGPNGAGKTTLFNLITGFTPPPVAAKSAGTGVTSPARRCTSSLAWALRAPSRICGSSPT
ncbi:ATP-binding cassette domain-containing protein [Acerihabitans sp. KWT182]|uniref:ATP-binding cassette domain-containing protein n=1 Tax=Acerihabitans sp. KWT182 TaxID=3157919 RepID=A0AAU7QEF5_9GAMM